MSEQISVLGAHLESLSVQESLKKAEEFLNGDALRIIGAVSAETLLNTESSEEYRQQIEQLNLQVIREREILEAGGVTDPERLWEAEENWFFAEFLALLQETGRTVILLAKDAAERQRLERELRETCPRLRLAGSFSFAENGSENPDSLLNQMNAIAADVILAALPCPEQETFAYRNRQKLNARIWAGLGREGSIRKGAKAQQSFLARLLEKRAFKKRVSEFSEEN